MTRVHVNGYAVSGNGTPAGCALGAALHDLVTGRHEPDESRGSRPDL